MSDRAGKRHLLAVLAQEAPSGARWALRGGADAVGRWLETDGVKDLDLWVHAEDLNDFCAALAQHVKGVISLESDPRWLRHVVFVMSEDCGSQLLDISYGDLTVGAALTCPQDMVSTVPSSYGPILNGVSVVADLVLRKLMRGKLPRKDQMAEARCAWQYTAPEFQAQWHTALEAVLGARLMVRVRQFLDGAEPQRSDQAAFVLSALNASRRRAGLSLMLRRRRRFAPGQQARTLFKRPIAPILVAVRDRDAARDAEQMLHALGVCYVPSADTVTSTIHVLRAAMLGQTVIATREQIAKLPRLTGSLFGGYLPFDPRDHASAIAGYLAAAHRWYIDKPEAACKLVLSAAGTNNE
jgi:hypothetical protein